MAATSTASDRRGHHARPGPGEALDAAGAMVYEGVRVDMGTLASRIGVGRATLYRWFGSREALLEQLVERFALAFLELARDRARGVGDARVLDIARHVMEATVEFEPARRFVAREPQLALRLLLGAGGAVHETLARALREALAETRTAAEMAALEEPIESMVQVAAALQWATFAIGDEPQIERAIEIIALMLGDARHGRS